ncbi:MAG TPA: hypothetical protein VJN22_06740 [Candidatus Eremiobacteraceae bacterium]|nr:hypothetical protein [Candidatus Eremiobacteraceae bacterium]
MTTVKNGPDSRDANSELVNMEHHAHAEELELQDRIVVSGPANGNPETAPVDREFEVVGIIEDSDSGAHFAVCYSEAADEFIVTDKTGGLIESDSLAQNILNDFLEQASDAVAEDE